jgi:hypothetical protein
MKLLKELLFKVAKPITNRTLVLKNRHHGESCYVYGDGVSIKWFDLTALPNRPGFTLSCIPFHNQAATLDLRYGLLIEPYYFYPYFKMPTWSKNLTWWRNTINRKYKDLFRKNPGSNYFVNLSNYPVLNGENIYYLYQGINDELFEFADDCKRNNIGILDGSLRCAISLAIYMGFKEITLVGCDYTHEISRSMHWYEKGKGVITPQQSYEHSFFEIAQKYASIITLTHEGGGSALPSITYSEFTGMPATYRENHELLDYETLKLLATWPGYSIL